jgi:hypothetical protein
MNSRMVSIFEIRVACRGRWPRPITNQSLG